MILQYKLEKPARLSDDLRKSRLITIHELIKEAWGHFPQEFIDKHVLNSEILSLVFDAGELAGFSAISKKKLAGRTVYYIEFTVLRPKYQGGKIGAKVTFNGLKQIFVRNLVSLLWRPVEIMLITPNIRVVATLAKNADFIYPNPYDADHKTSRIDEADDVTWQMAKDLIKKSDSPTRKLDREALVLHDSYADTPWLIYDGDNIPWHRHGKVNDFARHYLGYGNKEDKEFIVRASYGLGGLLRYIFGTRKR